ncbi:MAG: ABC transporter ATP-binding protein [Mycoplasmoidaceae bacterium]
MSKIRDEYKFDISLGMSEDKSNAPFIIDYDPPKGENKLIEFKNITKVFNNNKTKFTAVDDLSFSLYENENVALLGANGAGKTTIVEMMIGLNTPTSGEISYLYDYEYNFQEAIGIQFQDSSYPIGLNVSNIIDFMIDVYNIDITKDEIISVVKSFGLLEYLNKPAKSLSGGQQQRFNILLALLHKPKIVFLDELSTGLDIYIKNQIRIFVKNYCEKFNINIVLVSHDIEEIDNITDRIIIIQKGKIKVDINKNKINKYAKSLNDLINKYI